MNTIEQAIEDFKEGKMVVMVDDPKRENEGDLVIAAEKITPEAINFMATYGKGLICLAMDPAEIDRLGLPMMVEKNKARFGTAFTVSIEAKMGITTGISAFDRAHTVKTALEGSAEDIVSPGHIFPLRSKPGGVLERTGQTEGSVDLAKLSGFRSAAVICEIMKEDGTMARVPDLEVFCKKYDIKLISIADIIEYRRSLENK